MSLQDDITKLLTKHQRRLQKLREQRAQFGINTPVEILTEIEDIEAEIEKLNAELKTIEHRAEAVHHHNVARDQGGYRQRASFIYGGPVPPSHFVGRQHEVGEILDRLAYPVRGSTAIFGDPRVGKTSLLHYLRDSQISQMRWLASNSYHFLYLDCFSIVPFSEADFWRHTLRELAPHLRDDEFLNGRIQHLLAQASPDNIDLNNLFDNIARRGRLAVLMLDEFEWVTESLDRNSPGLLYQLRALLNRPERGLALLIAARRPLKQLCIGFNFYGSPFDNPFATIALSPFSEIEVDQLFDQYQADFSSAERAYLRQVAGTHPYLIQLSASLIMRMRSKDIELPFIQIETDLEDETDGHFADILSYSSALEKMLLAWLALAPLNQHMPAGGTHLRDLARGFGYYDQEMSQLIKRGLVLREMDGYRLFSSVFSRWVLRKLIVTAGRELLSTWEPYYVHFLSPVQREALEALVDKVIQRPAVIKMPELLAQLSTQEKSSLPSGPVSGRQLGRYIIEEQIGGGGMADIFKARDPRLDRLVAIKILRATLSKDEEFQTRFLREAQAIATLRHPHIVQVYDFDIQSGHYYMIIMEFIQGRNLQEYLSELQTAGQRMPWEEVVRIAAAVAEALDYAHERNMIHRDVKPSNILLADDGGIFLADFGLVRLLGQTDLTQAGRVVGTLAYMAPEQMMGGGEEINYRADIYAFGCVVYEMITGQPPFETATLPLAHFNAEPPSPRLSVPALPETAAQVILKALAKDPSERPISSSWFIKDLRQALDK
jgi:tRNA A-37 threonylcarbamoyl transferase component Bud32